MGSFPLDGAAVLQWIISQQCWNELCMKSLGSVTWKFLTVCKRFLDICEKKSFPELVLWGVFCPLTVVSSPGFAWLPLWAHKPHKHLSESPENISRQGSCGCIPWEATQRQCFARSKGEMWKKFPVVVVPDVGRSCWGVLLKYEQICPGVGKIPWNWNARKYLGLKAQEELLIKKLQQSKLEFSEDNGVCVQRIWVKRSWAADLALDRLQLWFSWEFLCPDAFLLSCPFYFLGIFSSSLRFSVCCYLVL